MRRGGRPATHSAATPEFVELPGQVSWTEIPNLWARLSRVHRAAKDQATEPASTHECRQTIAYAELWASGSSTDHIVEPLKFSPVITDSWSEMSVSSARRRDLICPEWLRPPTENRGGPGAASEILTEITGIGGRQRPTRCTRRRQV
jgi:hypothetical protein